MARALNTDEQRFLLDLARRTLECSFRGERLPEPAPPPGPVCEIRGAFVTLTEHGELRGCIGHVEGVVPLWRSVQDNAIAAAFRDPRFPPLAEVELTTVHIEISALSPLERVTPEEVVVGRHGVLVERSFLRGLLLPQVAPEHGWDRLTLLDHTCRKAGMAPGCWRSPDTSVFVFTADVFGEEPA